MGALMCATHSGRIASVMSPEIITSNMTFIMLWIFLIPALQRCNKVRPTQHDLWWMRYQMQQRNSLANAHNNTTWGKWRYINCNSVPFWNKLAFLKVARLLKIFEVFSKIFFFLSLCLTTTALSKVSGSQQTKANEAFTGVRRRQVTDLSALPIRGV